jgi:hypothetical protein
VEDIVAALPVRYREILTPKIRDLANAVDRACSTAKQILALESALASGEYPGQIQGAVKVPPLQLTQEYRAAHPDEVDHEVRALKTAASECRTKFLELELSAFRRQMSFFEGVSSPDKVVPVLRGIIQSETESLATRFPVREEATRVLESGEQVTVLAVNREKTVARYENMRALVSNCTPLIVDAVRGVVEARYTRAAAATAAKNKLRKQATDAMAVDSTPDTDAGSSRDVSRDDMRKMLREELQKELSVRTFFLSEDYYVITTDYRFPEIFQKGQEVGPEATIRSSARKGKGRPEKAASPCERQREVARQISADRSWNFLDSDSYPDSILTLAPVVAINVLISRAPIDYISMQRFRSRVHCHPDLEVPDGIARKFSVGNRYIPRRRIKPELPLLAWEDFERRLRWNIYFQLNPKKESGTLPYDPDLDVRRRLDKRPGPRLPDALEAGITEGRALVTAFRPAEPTVDERRAGLLGPDLSSRTQDYVIRNRVIITQSDKNLGIAIIDGDWYRKEIYNLLNNSVDYRSCDMTYAFNKLFTHAVAAHDILRELDASTGFRAETQLRNFLWDSLSGLLEENDELYDISEDVHNFRELCESKELTPAIIPGAENVPYKLGEWARHIPRFHGLPKIHKVPWKLRPIMPCHSVIFANFYKIMSKMLKLLIRQRPYVLESTHDLCQLLHKVDLRNHPRSAGEDYYIISGDIVAYYPNVPVADARAVVAEYWNNYCNVTDIPDIYKLLFPFLLSLVDINPICQFEDKYFEQIRGLAMGAHCAPDLANLYAAKFEEKFVAKLISIIFYRRFIDDIFILVTAKSEDAALVIANQLVIPGCQIGWNVSRWSTAFLDAYIYYDPISNKLEHKPFMKTFNHRERIPWISSHPTYIKKGAVIGEISRLAVLSSKENHFLAALIDLAKLYKARGYPDKLVNKWIFDNHKARWEKKFIKNVRDVAPLIIKSEFNQIWNSFPLSELESTIKTAWATVPPADSSERPRKRPRARTYGPKDRKPARIRSEGVGLRTDPDDVTDSDDAEDLVADVDLILSGLQDRRIMLTQKRVRNSGDIFNTWKQTLIYDVMRDHYDSELGNLLETVDDV